MKFRKERLNSVLRDELSKIIQKEIEFPAGVLATITEVDTAPDWSEAKVGVAVFPSDKSAETLKILNGQASHFYSLVFKKLKIYSVPKIKFVYDPGSENAARVEEISLKQ